MVGNALEDVLTWTLEVVNIGNKLCFLNKSQSYVFPLLENSRWRENCVLHLLNLRILCCSLWIGE